MAAFLDRSCDSASAMSYNELAAVYQSAHPDTGRLYTKDDLYFIDYNAEEVASMEDGIIASSAWLDQGNNADIAVRFLRASFKGWMYARDFPADTLTLFPSSSPLFSFQLHEVNKLLWPSSEDGVGLTSDDLIKRTADISYRFGVIDRPVNLTSFYRKELPVAAHKNLGTSGFVWGATPYGPGSADFVGEQWRAVEVTFCKVGDSVLVCDLVKRESDSSWIDFSDPIGITIMVLLVGFIALTFALIAVLVKFRRHTVIRTASFKFVCIMCVGLICGLASIFPLFGEPTRASCAARNWLIGLAYILFFGSFLLKTWRIHRIFNNARLITFTMPDRKLLMALTAMVVIEVALLVLFTIVGDLRPQQLPNPTNFNEYTTECVVDNEGTWVALLYAYKAVILGYGLYLALAVRNVRSEFNESKYLAFSVYNLAVVCIVVIPIINGVASITGYASSIFKAFAIFVGGVPALAILIVPKLMVIANYDQYKAVHQIGGRHNHSNATHFSNGTNGTEISSSMLQAQIRVRYAHTKELINRKEQIASMQALLVKELEAINKELRARGEPIHQGTTNAGNSVLSLPADDSSVAGNARNNNNNSNLSQLSQHSQRVVPSALSASASSAPSSAVCFPADVHLSLNGAAAQDEEGEPKRRKEPASSNSVCMQPMGASLMSDLDDDEAQ